MAKYIIKHNGVFVVGFDEHTRRVYFTRNFNNARLFEKEEVETFIAEHDNRGQCFRRINVTLWQLRKGERGAYLEPERSEAHAS